MTSGIIEILIENAGVQTAVGQDIRSKYKVYPVVAPQYAQTPYITVSEESIRPTLGKSCPSTLDAARYHIMVFSTDFLETETIQEACRLALDNGQGFTTDVGAEFGSVYMIDRKDLWHMGTGEGGGLYVKLGVYEAESIRDDS